MRSQVCSQKNDALRLGGPSEPWPLGVTGSCISSARMLVALGHAVPGPTGQRVATPAPDLRRAGASPLGRGLRQPPRRNVLCFEVPLPPRPVPPGATGTGTKALSSRGAATSLCSAPAGQAGARGRVGTQPSASLEEPLPQGTAGCAGSAGSIPRRWPKAPVHGSPSAPPSLPEAHPPPRGRLP